MLARILPRSGVGQRQQQEGWLCADSPGMLEKKKRMEKKNRVKGRKIGNGVSFGKFGMQRQREGVCERPDKREMLAHLASCVQSCVVLFVQRINFVCLGLKMEGRK